jgi:ABC-type molybdate transport system ATPase subunit
MNQDQKVKKFAEQELARLAHNVIVVDEGICVAFGKYQLVARDQRMVVSTWDREIHEFENQRVALSWCIADKFQQHNLARQLLTLDIKHQQLAADIACRLKVASRSRTQGFYETVEAKIQPKIAHLQTVTAELEKCVSSAKYLQTKGFTNETARLLGSKAK